MAHVLLVDDDEQLLRLLERYLGGIGHHVRTARDGREALVALDEGGVDLLITDLNMPDVDGLAMLNTLRARQSRLPIIAMSGGGRFQSQMLLALAGLLGAVVTIEKPFDLDELRACIERVLEAHDALS